MISGTLFIDFYPEFTSKMKDKGKNQDLNTRKWIDNNISDPEEINLTQSALIRLIQGSGSGKTIGFQYCYYYKLKDRNFTDFIRFVSSSAQSGLAIQRNFEYIKYQSSKTINLPDEFLKMKSGNLLVNVAFFLLKSVNTINYIQNYSRKILGGITATPIKSTLLNEVKDESGFRIIADTFYLIKPSPSKLNARAIGAQYIYSYHCTEYSSLRSIIDKTLYFLERKTKQDMNKDVKGKIWSNFYFGYLTPVNV